MKLKLTDVFSKASILERAKNFWDEKPPENKIKVGKKYRHLFSQEETISWDNKFDLLTEKQRILIIKGELIRTYDDLPNLDKTKIKYIFNLSHFSPKWFRLTHEDKKKILNHII